MRACPDVVLIAIAQAGVSKDSVPLAITDLARSDGRRAFFASTGAAVEPPNAATEHSFALVRTASVSVSHIVSVVRATPQSWAWT